MSVTVSRPSVADAEGLLSGRVALLAAIVFHGPLDVALTTAFWGLESNPAVLALGLGPWIALKTVALTALVVAWASARPHRVATWSVWTLVALGALLIAPNVYVAGVA